MANPPSKKAPSKQRPVQKKPAPKSSGRPAGLFTWILVGVVVVAVLAIVIVKVSNGSSKFVSRPISSTIQSELMVPASVFDTVGVSSPSVTVAPLPTAKGQPPLNWADSTGVKRPAFFYAGAEFCPFCAAERWPMIVALNRFGSFTGLYTMLSSSTDVYPNTPTFTFLHATYKSNYLTFSPVETEDRNHNQLQTMNAQQSAVYVQYNQSKNIPFASINNQAFILYAQPSPSAFDSTTREQIASVLNDPTNPLTQGIIAEANYISSAICHMDGQAPTNVCTSSGVKAADAKMGFKS